MVINGAQSQHLRTDFLKFQRLINIFNAHISNIYLGLQDINVLFEAETFADWTLRVNLENRALSTLRQKYKLKQIFNK